MRLFRLTFLDYNRAWHENVRERIKRIDKEHLARDEKPPEHGLYYNCQFDDIPFDEWEEMFGWQAEYDKDYVEFEI